MREVLPDAVKADIVDLSPMAKVGVPVRSSTTWMLKGQREEVW